jgi:hypothetical protein
MYEYSRLDDRIDFSTFYHEDMWKHGILDDTSRTLINQYQRVPLIASHLSMGLEFDCGSRLPALFARLHVNDTAINQQIIESLATIVDAEEAIPPPISKPLQIEDIGIFPERATGLFRVLIRSDKNSLKRFADDHGCVNTEIISESRDTINESMGVSFDWDNKSMTNFMFHSSTIHHDDPWVIDTTQHAHEHIARLFHGYKYNISRFVKVSLNTLTPPDYMKAYFTVRTPR